MTTIPTATSAGAPTAVASGPLGRLGLAVLRHGRLTMVVWLLVVIGLGSFAPRVESSLSGAGWQASGSESVAARELAQQHFGGNASSALQVVIHSDSGPLTSPAGQQTISRVEQTLTGDHRIASVIAPQPGATLSKDGRTAIVIGGAGADTNEMVRAASDLKQPLTARSPVAGSRSLPPAPPSCGPTSTRRISTRC